MKTLSKLALFAFCIAIGLAGRAIAEPKSSKQAPNSTINIQDSRNRIIRLTDHGLDPANITMKKEDSIVFFVNDTSESLTTLEIDFGDKPTHCGSANLKIEADGKVRSIRPFGPNDFSSTCFHAQGNYPVKIYGLKSNPQGVQTSIKVE